LVSPSNFVELSSFCSLEGTYTLIQPQSNCVTGGFQRCVTVDTCRLGWYTLSNCEYVRTFRKMV